MRNREGCAPATVPETVPDTAPVAAPDAVPEHRHAPRHPRVTRVTAALAAGEWDSSEWDSSEWDSSEWDHQAHAKPGGPYFYVDWDGDGAEWITLDAAESHSHYFQHDPPPVTGVIVEYHWQSGNTGRTLTRTKSPYIRGKFFQGITILKLSVRDQTGDVATGWTYIQVRKPKRGEHKPPKVVSISPEAGPPAGGISVTIKGANFYNSPVVTFSGIPVEYRVVDDTQIVAVSPKVRGTGTLYVSVKTGFGKSRDVPFEVDAAVGSHVAFRYTEVTMRKADGTAGPFALPLATCIKLGPDGRYYLGSRDGYIYKLALSRKLVVEQSCKSASVGKGRAVLGIAFHPHEWSTPRAYVSTSALYWKKQPGVAWHNGDVEVWGSVPSAECMEFSHRVVTGLPVSNHDHGVNALVFTNAGDLLIAVGGTTNAGVHTGGDGVGGLPESALSGTVLIAKLSKGPAFDGAVRYSQTHSPGTARVVGGDVAVYAHGMRNVFGMTRHSNGIVYALDNGPNAGYGKMAVACGKAGAHHGQKDKLLALRRGAYYGHPNWSRARFDKRQCKFVKTGTKGLSSYWYTKPLAELPSSTNGIVEYTANTFEGKMRGRLLMSKMSWGNQKGIFEVTPGKGGRTVLGEPRLFQKTSGLAIEQGPFGELLLPNYVAKKLFAYVPVDDGHEALRVIAVSPRRGPASGVNPVLVTGNGFWEGVKIYFGGKECLTYKARTHESVWCQVPPGNKGAKVAVVAKHNGLVSKSYGNEYEYMAY